MALGCALALSLVLGANAASRIDLTSIFSEALTIEQRASLGDRPNLDRLASTLDDKQRKVVRTQLDRADRRRLEPAEAEQLARAYLLLGAPDSALSIAAGLLDREPDTLRWHHLLLEGLSAKGDYAGVAAAAHATLRIDPNDKVAHSFWQLSKGRGTVSKPATPHQDASERHDTASAVAIAASHLRSNLPIPPAPDRQGSPDFDPLSAAIGAALGATGSFLLVFGFGRQHFERRIPGITRGIGIAVAIAAPLVLAGALLVPTTVPLANSMPTVLARVVPFEGEMPPMLARVGEQTAFVTAADDIAGMNAAQIARRLSIDQAKRYLVIRFRTPGSGISSPIRHNDPLFVGRGLTKGGAREFLVPNRRIDLAIDTLDIIDETPLPK